MTMNKIRKYVSGLSARSLFIFSLICSTSVCAEEMSNRELHRFGINAGFGDPFPTIMCGGLEYNVSSFLRFVVGAGALDVTWNSPSGYLYESGGETVGGGFRLFVPGWNFSPMLGAEYAAVFLNSQPVVDSTYYFTASRGSHIYAIVGIDWQAACGSYDPSRYR